MHKTLPDSGFFDVVVSNMWVLQKLFCRQEWSMQSMWKPHAIRNIANGSHFVNIVVHKVNGKVFAI